MKKYIKPKGIDKMYLIKQGNVLIDINGEEDYFWKCDGCGKIRPMDIDSYLAEIDEYGLYEVKHYCNACASKRRAANETEHQSNVVPLRES